MMFVEVSSSHFALSRLDENWMRNQRLKPSRRSLPVGQLGLWEWLRGLRFEIIESHRIIESSPCHRMSSYVIVCHRMSSYDISMYPFTVLTRWTHRLRRWTACCGQGQCQPETELCEIVARTARMSHLWTANMEITHCDKDVFWTKKFPGEAACLGCPHGAAHSAGDAGDIAGDIGGNGVSSRHLSVLSYENICRFRSVQMIWKNSSNLRFCLDCDRLLSCSQRLWQACHQATFFLL